MTFITTRPLVYKCTLGDSHPCPRWRGRLAGGERWPGLANKWCHAPIGLTTSRLVVVVWPEVAPAGDGGEVAAPRPLRLGLR
jgi:hypothetical protein